MDPEKPPAAAEVIAPGPRMIVIPQNLADLKTRAEAFIRREPTRSLLFALLAGLLVGRLIQSWRRAPGVY